MPESMVGLDTWADHHLILRPVVNTGHKNRGDNQVACSMNLRFVNHLAAEHCLRQACPVRAHRYCLRDLRDDSGHSTRHEDADKETHLFHRASCRDPF
jgi:hypothetical protein